MLHRRHRHLSSLRHQQTALTPTQQGRSARLPNNTITTTILSLITTINNS
jgi:hypothetical protein